MSPNKKLTTCMHVLPLIFFLIFNHALVAYADWVGFSEDGKGNTVYIDPDTILRKGKLVKIWVLLDARSPHQTIEGTLFLSSRTLHQYDCDKERFRFLAFLLYSGNMGTGQTVHANHTLLDWEPVPAKGVARRLLERVCK